HTAGDRTPARRHNRAVTPTPLTLIAGAAFTAALAMPAVRAQTPAPAPVPAFAGQTRAPAPATPSPAVTVETITGRLSAPWSIAFLPDGRFLVTEAAGTIRIVRPDGVVSAPVAGVPDVKV